MRGRDTTSEKKKGKKKQVRHTSRRMIVYKTKREERKEKSARSGCVRKPGGNKLPTRGEKLILKFKSLMSRELTSR
jgi:hypothetical protein